MSEPSCHERQEGFFVAAQAWRHIETRIPQDAVKPTSLFRVECALVGLQHGAWPLLLQVALVPLLRQGRG